MFGVSYFGPRAGLVLGLTVLLCMAAGIVPRLMSGEPFRLLHPGSLITGLLIGLTVTADIPLYMLVVGTLVAQLPGKLPVRWLGRNPFNPAVLGRSAIAVLEWLDPPAYSADITTSASVLAKDAGGLQLPDLQQALLGLTPGAIGETSSVVLIAVGLVMLGLVVLKREAALAMIVTAPLLVYCLPPTPEIAGHAPWVLNPLVYLAGGSTLLCALFFATDPVTTPRTRSAGILFGAGAATIGVLGRLYTAIPGTEMFGILVMNLAGTGPRSAGAALLQHRRGPALASPASGDGRHEGRGERLPRRRRSRRSMALRRTAGCTAPMSPPAPRCHACFPRSMRHRSPRSRSWPTWTRSG